MGNEPGATPIKGIFSLLKTGKLKASRKNSPGQRPTGVLGSPPQSLCLYSSNIFDYGRRPGSPGDQSIPAGDYPERCFRPLAPQGSIFNRLFDVQSDIKKSSIFRIFQNRQKTSDKSTLERPRSHFGSKMKTFGLPLASIFRSFSKIEKV